MASSELPRLVVMAVIISFDSVVNISENASVTADMSSIEVLQITFIIFVSRALVFCSAGLFFCFVVFLACDSPEPCTLISTSSL